MEYRIDETIQEVEEVHSDRVIEFIRKYHNRLPNHPDIDDGHYSFNELIQLLHQVLSNGLTYFNLHDESYFGILEDAEGVIIQFNTGAENCGNLIVVNRFTRDILILMRGETDCICELSLSLLQHNQIVDLGRSGRRWEGSVLFGEPAGYGVEYDDEGRCEYEGFVFNGQRVCYGTEYYCDCVEERIKYRGCWNNGRRCGRGRMYDRNGEIDAESLWMEHALSMDEMITPILPWICLFAETIVLAGELPRSVSTIVLQWNLLHLRTLEISPHSLSSVQSFQLNNLPALQSLVIGKYSLDGLTDLFCIRGCPRLATVSIQEKVCMECNTMEILHLDSCTTISIGSTSFHKTQFIMVDSM